jgi:tetrahydrodipicolinate N-succinyltransferase
LVGVLTGSGSVFVGFGVFAGFGVCVDVGKVVGMGVFVGKGMRVGVGETPPFCKMTGTESVSLLFAWSQMTNMIV